VIEKLRQIIQEHLTTIAYHSYDATIMHKRCAYHAMLNLLDKYPINFGEYLDHSSNQHFGFQHLLFQEYISLLEQELPFVILKHKRPYQINNLLDDELHIFHGISIFEGMINDTLAVNNGTKEFYIGGRSAVYAKPYFLGKLLDVQDQNTQLSLMDKMVSYSFSKIQFRDVKPGTFVIVKHLRIPPHYQMGGMAHINKAKQSIARHL